MDLSNLTDEQKEKARACKSPDDILKLAREEGYELSDEELESVAGGFDWYNVDWSHGCKQKLKGPDAQ